LCLDTDLSVVELVARNRKRLENRMDEGPDKTTRPTVGIEVAILAGIVAVPLDAINPSREIISRPRLRHSITFIPHFKPTAQGSDILQEEGN